MSYVNITLGSFAFNVNPSSMRVMLYRRPGQLKILGRNISQVESMGNEGIVVIRFVGTLIDTSGISKKSDFVSLYDQYRRNDPLLFIADMFSTKAACGWCFINEFSPIELGGRVQSYEYGLSLTVIGFSDEWTRALIYTSETVNNDWGLVGDKVIPGITSASGSSETATFNRTLDNGLTLPCYLNPKLSYIKFTAADAGFTGSDIYMGTGSLEYWCSGSESGWNNELIELRTRQDEATMPGMVEVWMVTGSATNALAKSLVAYLDFQVKTATTWASGSDTGSIVVKSAPANKYENKYHTIAKMFYPQTSTGSVIFNVFYETYRGKPGAKIWVENATSGVTLTGCRYKLIVNTGSAGWQSLTAYRSGSTGTTLWATSGSQALYNCISGSGANDTGTSGSVTMLSTNYPLWGGTTGSNMIGFIRPLRDTFNHVAKGYSGSTGGSGTGSYWYEIWAEYTGSSITYGNFFPEVFLFAQSYGLQGSRDENALAKEFMMDVNLLDDVVPLAT